MQPCVSYPSPTTLAVDPQQTGTSAPARPAFCLHGQFVQRLTPARKRAFRRAQHRAVRDGSTRYRGQYHTPESLALKSLGKRASHRASSPHLKSAPGSHQSSSAFQLITWNCGGLTSVRYKEFLAWLSGETPMACKDASSSGSICHRAALACLQETHWPTSSEYQSQGWTMIHSGTGTSTGGVLIAVSHKLVPPHLVRHTELIPGRVVHVRLETTPPIDALGVYQVAWNPNKKDVRDSDHNPAEELVRRRAEIWRVIRSWMASIPQRNALYVLGDLNCTLMPHLPNIGTGLAHHASMHHPDQASLQRLLLDFNLTALNTWGKSGSAAQTFLRPPSGGVQIDFILTRMPGTPRARMAQPLPNAPVVHPTRMRHVPVTTIVPYPQVPRTAPAQHWNPKQIRQDLQQTPELARMFQQKLEMQLPTASDLDSCITTAWKQAKSSMPRPTSDPPPKPEQISGAPPSTDVSLKTFWQIKTRLRQQQADCTTLVAPLVWMMSQASPATVWQHQSGSARACVGRIFRLWRSGLAFDRCNRSLRQRAKTRKIEQVNQLIEATTQAAQKAIQGCTSLSINYAPKRIEEAFTFETPRGIL